jgi:histidine triad (HIT) family protein
MPDCIFCKIVNKEIPSVQVYEDEDIIAFLDINPANKGHTLVAPKKHYDDIFSVDEELLEKMIAVVKTLAERIKKTMNCEGLNVVQNNGRCAGQLVNHIHFHIIPRFPGDKVLITYQRQHLTEEELKEVQQKLTEKEREVLRPIF